MENGCCTNGNDGIFGNEGFLTGLLLPQALRGGAFGSNYGADCGTRYGAGYAATGLADAAAAASITSSKDAVEAVTAAKDYITANVDKLAAQCCCSTEKILQAVNCLTPQIMQGFFSTQAAINSGFSAASLQSFQSQTAVTGAVTDSKFALSSQADSHAAAQALAECHTQNLINTTSAAGYAQAERLCCEVKQVIHADGEATRKEARDREEDRLRTELSDAKQQICNQQQTAAIAAMLDKNRCNPCCNPCYSPCCCNGSGNGNGNGNSSRPA